MAIDFSKTAKDQELESTGPIKERPLPNDDIETDDDGYEPEEVGV